MRFNKLSILALAALLMGTAPAFATTIVVDSSSDTSVANDGECSCREALANANADDNVASGTDCAAGSGADIITLPAGIRHHLVHQHPVALVVQVGTAVSPY